MLTLATSLSLLAQDDFQPFLGEDFFPWIILAFGGAMVVGNVVALLRPPPEAEESSERPPVARAVVLIVIGLAAGAWGLASLVA